MLGDLLETALSGVGITKERVERWLGRECHCQERKEKMNQLTAWMRMLPRLTLSKSLQYIRQLIET